MKKIFKYLCGGLMMMWLGGGLLPTKAVADKVTLTTMYYWLNIDVVCAVGMYDPNGTIHIDFGNGYTRDYEAKYVTWTKIQWLYDDYYGEKARTVTITTDYPLTGLKCETIRDGKYINGLTYLDLSDCPSLLALDCSGDDDCLSTPNHFSSLDLSGLTSLSELNCSKNGLTSLDLSDQASLKQLNCSSNELTTLQFEGELLGLNAANNHLALSVLNILSKKWNGKVYGSKPLILSPQRIVQTLTVGENWDLTSEMTIDGTATAYTLTDEAGEPVSEAAYAEKDGVFRFRRSGKYLLTLKNPQVTDYSYYDKDYDGYVADEQVEVIYEVTVSGTDIAVYMVDVAAPAGGTASQSGSGRYEAGETVTVTATPAEGYTFVHWVDADGNVKSVENPYTFAVTSDVALTAVFKIYHTVDVAAPAGGTVLQSGSGRYEEGETVTVTATPSSGFRFVNWERMAEQTVFATEAEYTFQITENLKLKANFVKEDDPTTPDDPDTPDDPTTPDDPDDPDDPTTPDDPAAIEDLTAGAAPEVYVKEHTVYVTDNTAEVYVYTLGGRCVYSGRATAIPIRQSGVYVVSVGGRRCKILIP